MNEAITSFRNPLIKRIKRLRMRKYREREDAYFIEGPRLFLSAVEQNAPVQHIVYSKQLLTSHACYQAIEKLVAVGVPASHLAADVFQSIAAADRPAGIGAIVQQPARPHLGDVHDKLFVALMDVADPGNVGTIMRTLDACGGNGLILSGNSTDPYHPTSVKASMGAILTIPVLQFKAADNTLAWARDAGLWIVATSAHATKQFWSMEARQRASQGILLLMGSERHGLPDEIMDTANECVTIPMQGSVSSLNLAVATALLLFELRRPGGNEQRPQHAQGSGPA